MADQLSLREDFDAVCDQVQKNNRRKHSVGSDSLSSSVPSRDGSVDGGFSSNSCMNMNLSFFSRKLLDLTFEILT